MPTPQKGYLCLQLINKPILGYNFPLSLKKTCVKKERISEIIEGHSNGDR
jgi:hypothetical protein